MSNIGSMIAASADLGIGYSQRLLVDVTPELFPRFATVGSQIIESNHPAFIYGHLSLYASRVITQVGGDASQYEASQKFVELFSKDAKCVDDPEGTIYPPMQEVTEFCIAGYRAAAEALRGADDEIMRAENPNEAMREKFPTNGAMLGFYVGGHFMLHMGQMSAWRRAVGLGPA